MAFDLDKTQEILVSNVINKFSITGLNNDIENENITIAYMLYTQELEPYKRGYVQLNGYDAVKDLYAQIDVEIATGLKFEEASAKILYKLVVQSLAN